ncbi:MAG: hypothetical protein EXQ67_07720 [Thermoleophilia bacterium]|nr:hypothetical protein [Thermoleophilia bacterium]
MTSLLVVATFCVAAVGITHLAPNRVLRVLWVLLPFLIAIALIAYARRSSIYLQAPISIDEAQFLADAIKVSSGQWVPWVDFDTGTVGFVIPYGLVPIVIGFPSDPYFASRILAIVCAAVWAFGSMLAFRTTLAPGISLVLAAPLILIAGLPGSGDLLTFSSELLPLALAFGGFGVALYASSKQRSLWLTAIGFLMIGLVPFAKLQVAPVALLLAIIAITQGLAFPVLWRDRRRTLVALTAGLAPLAAVLLGMIGSPVFRGRVRDVVAFTQSYTAGGDPWQTTLRFFFRGEAFYDLARLSCLAAVIAAFMVVLVPQIRQHRGRRSLALVAVMAPIGLISMSLPGRGFPHYVWVGAVPALFGVLALAAVVLSLLARYRQRNVIVVAAAVVLVILLPSAERVREALQVPPLQLTQDVWDSTPWFPPSDPPTSITGLGTPDQLAVKRALETCPGPIGVWGWDPQILVVTHRPYLGRGSVVPQEDIPAQSAWAGAMVEGRPNCIVDATGPTHFLFSCGDGCALQNQTFAGPVLEGYHRILDLPDYRVYKRSDSS